MIAPFVDGAWLERHRGEVVVADVRWYLDGRSGAAAFTDGHVPGAVFVDLERWLADGSDPTKGRHPLPSAERFAEGMSSCGIGDGDTVVAYDDEGGVIAARLVWMLRATGHAAALLDGGLDAYRGALEAGQVEPRRARFTTRPWPPARLATLDDVGDRRRVVLDARSPERYRGDAEPLDARAGHVPGARNVPCRENLTASGTLRPIDEIRHAFRDAGVVDANDVISYCGSGVTACHNLLTMELSGLGVGRLYAGSWSEYSRAGDRELATGDAPG